MVCRRSMLKDAGRGTGGTALLLAYVVVLSCSLALSRLPSRLPSMGCDGAYVVRC
jgi:hypothetical protein